MLFVQANHIRVIQLVLHCSLHKISLQDHYNMGSTTIVPL